MKKSESQDSTVPEFGQSIRIYSEFVHEEETDYYFDMRYDVYYVENDRVGWQAFHKFARTHDALALIKEKHKPRYKNEPFTEWMLYKLPTGSWDIKEKQKA